MTEAELLALHDRHAEAILRAMKAMPTLPLFDSDGSFKAAQRDHMMVLLGALLALGVPSGDAKELALDITMMISDRLRENLGHKAGHG